MDTFFALKNVVINALSQILKCQSIIANRLVLKLLATTMLWTSISSYVVNLNICCTDMNISNRFQCLEAILAMTFAGEQ